MARVIKPKEMTDAMLLSCNVAEPDIAGGEPAVWSVSTAYALGDRCTVVASHKVYECIADAGVTGGSIPDVDVLSDAPKWAFVSYTNRWRVFDPYVNTQTTKAETLSFQISATRCTSVCVLNLAGSSVNLQLLDSAGTVVDEKTVTLVSRNTIGWMSYFFGDFSDTIDKVFWDFPVGFGTKLNITVSAPSGVAAVGMIKHGMSYDIGLTEQEVSGGIVDFSVKDEDSYGNTYLKQGMYHDLLDVSLYIDTAATDAITRLIKSLRGMGCVWILDNETSLAATMQMLVVYGYYKDFGVVIKTKHPGSFDQCNLTLEGLV